MLPQLQEKVKEEFEQETLLALVEDAVTHSSTIRQEHGEYEWDNEAQMKKREERAVSEDSDVEEEAEQEVQLQVQAQEV